MSNFEKACNLSCTEWAQGFNADTEYQFSENFANQMDLLCSDNNSKTKRRKFSKRTITILIAAAIILSITITAFAVPSARKFIIKKFSDHSEYTISSENANAVNAMPTLEFIPDDFVPTDTTFDEISYFCKYENQNGKYFYVEKNSLNTFYAYDTEHHNSKIIEYKSVSYIVFKSSDFHGVIWNDGMHTYEVLGNLSENEILNIAICTK